jgi:hypothetical protein
MYIFHVAMQPNSSNHNNHPPEPSDYIPADTPVDSASVAASDTAFVAVGERTVGARIGCSRVAGRRGVGIWGGWLGRCVNGSMRVGAVLWRVGHGGGERVGG